MVHQNDAIVIHRPFLDSLADAELLSLSTASRPFSSVSSWVCDSAAGPSSASTSPSLASASKICRAAKPLEAPCRCFALRAQASATWPSHESQYIGFPGIVQKIPRAARALKEVEKDDTTRLPAVTIPRPTGTTAHSACAPSAAAFGRHAVCLARTKVFNSERKHGNHTSYILQHELGARGIMHTLGLVLVIRIWWRCADHHRTDHRRGWCGRGPTCGPVRPCAGYKAS